MLKKLIMALAVVGITATPYAALATGQVQVESQLKVRNNTTQGQFGDSVTLKEDQVVDIQVWYHNREEADSGLVAQNLKVAINLPTAPGKTQTIHSTVSADNANISTDSAIANLPIDSASLQPIAGSGVWRHNIGDNTNVNYVNTKLTSAQEQSLLSGGLVLENEKPCFNFEATVTIQARVIVPAVTIQKMVKVDGDKNATFATSNTAKPDQVLDYVLIIKNQGNSTLHQVQVGDKLPTFLKYVPNSTVLTNSNTGTKGETLKDENLTNGGITIDDMAPGSTQYVNFKAVLKTVIPCGEHDIKNMASVKAQGMPEIFNQAVTHVNGNGPCQTPPPPPTPPQGGGQLPQTGAEGALAGMTGTGVLGYAVNAYRKSKRSVADALRGIKR